MPSGSGGLSGAGLKVDDTLGEPQEQRRHFREGNAIAEHGTKKKKSSSGSLIEGRANRTID